MRGHVSANDHWLSREVTIVNPQGLHARPVMKFVDLAGRFSSAVSVKKGGDSVDGKSPMELMLLEAVQGTTLTLVARGADAAAALDALAGLVASGFDET